MRSNICSAILVMIISAGAWAQQPHSPGAAHPGTPPPPPHPMGQHEPGTAPGPGNWIRPHDTNDNGILEADEFTAALERTFAAIDKDNSGMLEMEELRPRPMHKLQVPRDGAVNVPVQPVPMNFLLPPFFNKKGRGGDVPLSRADFEAQARSVFAEMDDNGDGSLSAEEAAKHMPPHPAPPPHPPSPPNAHFIGAELRFGEKVVRGQPFSADIVIEETKRLFDGSLVSNQSRGAVYRDAAGRTRREQPLQVVAGFPVVGNGDRPQMLVFINDFNTRSHIFLDLNNKVARKSPIGNAPAPKAPGNPPTAKIESLGSRTIEGVLAWGTRTTFEMPAGHMGSDKPLVVTSEKWFSPDLQVIVLSRHIDPIGGEHVFRLVNIKRIEPVGELFSVPAGFRFDN